jgi:hypothetical protein
VLAALGDEGLHRVHAAMRAHHVEHVFSDEHGREVITEHVVEARGSGDRLAVAGDARIRAQPDDRER